MLPFLREDNKNNDGIAQQTRTPDKTQENQEDNDSSSGMEAAAHDLIAAIHSRDAKAVAEALKSAFEIADMAPHNEGPHTNETEE